MNVLRALAAVTTVLALVGAVPSESLSQTSSALSGRIVKFELHPSFDVRKTAIRETKQPWQRMWASDFTGDGCADLLTADEKGPLSLRISQCGNEFASPILLEQVLENAEERPVAAEINNDLCADLLFVGKDKIVSTFGDCRGKFEAR